MFQTGMAGVGRRLGSQHRRLASNLTSGPNPPLLPGERTSSLKLPLLSTSGTTVEDSPVQPDSPVHPASQEAYGTLQRPVLPPDLSSQVFGRVLATVPRSAPIGGRRKDVAGAPTLVPQIKAKFCTLAGDRSATDPGDNAANDMANWIKLHLPDLRYVEFGNNEKLCTHIRGHIDTMRATVLKFEDIYNEYVRPLLVSRCLIAPGNINDPSTAFLHSQTFRIANHNASYVSCFDVMVYRSSCKDEEQWDTFLTYLAEKKIYVIEDWLKSFSTIEVLMYDHGLKEPDDGTEEPFYKGECDAAYDDNTKTASLSYILWKDRKIIYAEVFKSVKCSSSVEAEIHAVMALFSKCKDLNIRKLQVWSDSRTVTSILTGELPIDMGHQQRDFFLMLRGMRSQFKSLVVTWKPRELMVFADFLARAAKLEDNKPYYSLHLCLEKFHSHLKGSPVIRIERTKSTTTAVKKFGNVMLEESYVKSGNFRYLIEVEEHLKAECLVGLFQSLELDTMQLFIGTREKENLESLKKTLHTICEKVSILKSPPTGRTFFTLSRDLNRILNRDLTGSYLKNLAVVYDFSVREDVYSPHGNFQVLLVTPSERQNMKEKIEELTGLGYIYFNGVRLPLNEERAKTEENESRT